MNLILFQDDDILENGNILVTDSRAKHIAKVLHCEVGDRVRVGRLNGRIGIGTILSLQPKFPFCVEMQVKLTEDPPSKVPLDMILALPRPIMLKRVFGYLGQLGIASLHVIQSERVEKSFWHANIFERHEYEPFLVGGLEQAVDTVLPKIYFYKKFKTFMKDILPEMLKDYDKLLFAHPRGAVDLNRAFGGCSGKALVAIGPEGGWLEHEAAQFISCGFTTFTIGERILKVDTAVVNIHGRIMAML